jgi:hypothetical protein
MGGRQTRCTAAAGGGMAVLPADGGLIRDAWRDAAGA